jgi:hypothetical protein
MIVGDDELRPRSFRRRRKSFHLLWLSRVSRRHAKRHSRRGPAFGGEFTHLLIHWGASMNFLPLFMFLNHDVMPGMALAREVHCTVQAVVIGSIF